MGAGTGGDQVIGWQLRWDTWHTPERSDRGRCSVGVVTLHSGQSSPGTPVLPCSTAGTGPVEKKEEDGEKVVIELPAVKYNDWSRPANKIFINLV